MWKKNRKRILTAPEIPIRRRKEDGTVLYRSPAYARRLPASWIKSNANVRVMVRYDNPISHVRIGRFVFSCREKRLQDHRTAHLPVDGA